MKKSFNVLVVFFALILAFCVTACSNSSGSGGSGGSSGTGGGSGSGSSTGNTVFSCKDTEGKGTKTFTFYKDGTWVLYAKGFDKGVDIDLNSDAGTYTGDPAKDGECTLKYTKEADVASAYLFMLFSGQTTGRITNENAPLQDLPENRQTTEIINIQNGSFTWKHYDGETYTRNE